MNDIFLSYSRKDTDTMQKVKQTLLDAGFTIWTDEGIEPGTPSWKDAIDTAIYNCKALVCILSPDAKQSKWVKAELDRAETYEKKIYLILARGLKRDSVPFGFDTHQYVDIRNPDNFTTKMNSLVGTIQRRIAKVQKSGETKPALSEIPESTSANTDSESDDSTSKSGDLPPALQHIKSMMPQPFDWCYIPAGDVTLEAGGYVPEGGQTYQVDAFYMAKYPVTNRQFAEFIAVGGYRTQAYWTDAGWELCQKNKWTQPRFYHDTKWNRPSHPVVGVTWYEAIAFCNWLNSLSGDNLLSLPTEQQWQRAAQGDDGRAYPWGDDWDTSRCNNNVDNKGTGKTTAVDQYPNGASPYAVLDMAGNVWEWCLTEYYSGSTALQDANAKAKNETNVWRVVRGGSWLNDDADLFRCDYGYVWLPRDGGDDDAFRLSLTYT